MKLYAAGLNAWNQLRFDNEVLPSQPEDLYEFEVILEGERIKPPASGLTYTKVWCDGKYHHAGGCAPQYSEDANLSSYIQPVENFAGETLKVEIERPQHEESPATYSLVKETFPRLVTDEAVRQSWVRTKPVAQIAAFHVGFIILYQNGTVETLGDRRFMDCLGRDVDDEHPAEEPQPVQALHDLGDPVQKVAAGGYTVAALTKSGALYIWGMRPPGDTSKQPVIAGLDQIPNYTEVDEDKDVQDVAVGESHAVVLTTDGHVYVIGRNDNGQLGLGRATQASTESWTKLHLNLPPNHRVVSIASGPRVSFILVSH